MSDIHRFRKTFNTPAVDQLTTDAYADVIFKVDGAGLVLRDVTEIELITTGPIVMRLENTDAANSIDYKVLGHVFPGEAAADKAVLVAEAALAALAVIWLEIDPVLYPYLAVQVKATVGSNQGDLKVQGVQLKV
jgi:hypothetical protein